MSSSSTQKALVIPSSGSPYTIISKPIPTPGPNDVLVRLESVGLNPVEWATPIIPQLIGPMVKFGGGYPVHVGTDGAGTVVDVGSNVDRVKKGDRVLFQGWFAHNYSTYQQYALAPADLVAKLPSNISTLEAASIPMALVVAAFGFALPDTTVPSLSESTKDVIFAELCPKSTGAGVRPFWEDGAKGSKFGEPIVILGGASSVGQIAIQIAKHMGYSPIITTSSTKHTEYLKSLGATDVVDRNLPIETLSSSVKEIVQGKPINIIFNAVRDLVQGHVDLLAPGGTIVITSIFLPPGIEFTDGRKDVAMYGAVHVHSDLGTGMMKSLEGFLESGVIRPMRVEKLPGGLAGIPKGLDRFGKNEVSGVKLVVDPTETA